jgi:hypothetical protein
MKNLFFLVLLVCIFMGCIKSKSIKEVNYHYITNTSGKKIVHEVICNSECVGEDTLIFFSRGMTKQSELEWKTSASFISYRQIIAYYLYTYIYCIDDTTSILWNGLWNVDPGFKDGNKYFKIVNLAHEETDNEHIMPVEYYLTVNDSLLLTMQKDYAMLDKFKEYYEQK